MHWSSLGDECDLGRRHDSICDFRHIPGLCIWKAIGRFSNDNIDIAIDSHGDILGIALE